MNNVVPFLPPRVAFSEDALAHQFVALHGDRFRYDHSRGCWFLWNGANWQADNTRVVRDAIRSICANAADHADLPSLARKLASAKTVTSVEMLVQTDPEVAVNAAVWDRDPFLLATPGPTIDLRIGSPRDSSPLDHITRVTTTAPAKGDCPIWSRFILEACDGDEDQVKFLQRMAGYALTGDTREHALFFIYGPGGNGKSVFLNVITGILGDYAAIAPIDTFTAARGERHPTDLAMLAGARLVTASETEEGRA